MKKKEYKSDNYNRLRNSKLPSINFYSKYFDEAIWKFDGDAEKMGLFVMAVYVYIHCNADPEEFKDEFYHTREFHIMFDKIMHNINMTADWWFDRQRQEKQYTKILTEDNNKK